MRALLAALLLALPAHAGDLVLVGVRDDPLQEPDAGPPRTILSVDFIGPDGRIACRRAAIRDAAMRVALFTDPVVVPVRDDLAYLVCPDEKGLRCLRLSWATAEDEGRSFVVPCDPGTRPVHVVPERVAFLSDRAAVTVDLRLGTHTVTTCLQRPLFLDPVRNRLYVHRPGRIDFHPFLGTTPPEALPGPPQALFALPEGAVEHAAVRDDGLQAAWVARQRSRRGDAERFLLSVADNRERLLVRRSLPGRFHDLRWLDDTRVQVTATQRETTLVSILEVEKNRLTRRALAERYLAPPEMWPASLAGREIGN